MTDLNAEWNTMQAAYKTHYVSEAMLIGKTDWRLVIRDFVIGWKVRACTEFQ
jgi:hypothetical protein